MTKNDIDALIEAVEEAEANRNALAVEIVEHITLGHDMTALQIRQWRVAQLGVQSTKRDLENALTIAANVEVCDG